MDKSKQECKEIIHLNKIDIHVLDHIGGHGKTRCGIGIF